MRRLTILCKEVMTKRCNEICDKISKENWYLDMQSTIIKKRMNISKNINNSIEKELNDYDDLKAEINNRIIDEIYMQAFKDGISAYKILTPDLTPNSDL